MGNGDLRHFGGRIADSTICVESRADSTKSADFCVESGVDSSVESIADSTKKAESTLDSTIFTNQFFPAKHFAKNFAKSNNFTKSQKSLPNTILIALGGNLKNPIATFKSLFFKLKRNAKIRILQTSPIYKNPPFGFCNQPFFYNATMLLATKMCLLEFYAFIFYVERIFGRGRIRAFKNAPRVIDIDIIFFNDIFLRSTKLNIPHPQWQRRQSVLIPLLFQVNYKGF